MTDYQAALAAVVRKTYQEHGLGDRPWGVTHWGCSYANGCAIGISLSPKFAKELDREASDDLLHLLKDNTKLQLELFGKVGRPPVEIADQLCKLQLLHDHAATSPNLRATASDARDAYKEAIELNFPDVDLTA